MNAEAIIAGCTLAGTIVSGVFSAIISGRLTNYRIKQLEMKVDKHNNLIERTYKLEENIKVLENEVIHLKEGE